MVRQLTGGGHFAAVARAANGQVAGVGGVFKSAPWEGLFEFGQLIVRREYRSGMLGFILNKYVVDELLTQIGAKAFFGEAVCHHTATQAMARLGGCQECALAVDSLPGSRPVAGVESPPRISLLYTFKVFEDEAMAVHGPKPYQYFIQEIYARMDLDRSLIHSGSDWTPGGRTVALLTHYAQAKVARLTVPEVGSDLVREVERAEAAAGADGWVQVSVNLADPGAPWAVEQLRDRGYFLGGLLPRWFGTDGFMMQRHPGIPDFGAIRLCSDSGRAVLEAVRRDFLAGQGRRSQD